MESASLYAGSVSGKMPADVAEIYRAEHGIGQRMGHGIGIGVTGKSARVRDRHAAENQGAAAREPVRVVADPHADHATAASGSMME